MKSLIKERTGAKPGGFGGYFKLNPRVDDIPDRFVVDHNGIKLLVMGKVREPAGGCMCPENVFLGRTSCKAVGCDCPCALFPAVADFDALGSVLKNFKRRKTGDVASFTPALFYGTDGGYTHAGN